MLTQADYAVSQLYAQEKVAAPALAAPVNYVSPVPVPEQLKYFQKRDLTKGYEARLQRTPGVRKASAILTNLLGSGNGRATAAGAAPANGVRTAANDQDSDSDDAPLPVVRVATVEDVDARLREKWRLATKAALDAKTKSEMVVVVDVADDKPAAR